MYVVRPVVADRRRPAVELLGALEARLPVLESDLAESVAHLAATQADLATSRAVLAEYRNSTSWRLGCGIGVLTAALATRCDSLISVDCVARAVRQARDRVQDMPWVEVREMTVPDHWPEGSFDLIVISELARYFGDDDLRQLIDRTIHSLEPGADFVLVHHRPDGAVPQSAEAVHGAFAARSELVRLGSYKQPEFLLDVLARAG